MEFSLNSLNCQIISHTASPIIGFCIDENCTESNKFACSECIFDIHPQHKMAKIKDVNNIIQTKYKDYKKSLEKDKKIIEEFNNSELAQIEKVEQLKKDIIKEIENKAKKCIEKIKIKYKDLVNSKAKDFTNLKEYEEFFIGNAAPIQKPDHSKLSEICYNIYKGAKKAKNIETPSSESTALERPKLFESEKKNNNNNHDFNLEIFSKKFDTFIEKENALMVQYINDKFLKNPENLFNNNTSQNFEWCEQTYSGYDFFYELTNNKTKGTKILSNGTMTILRAKKMMEDNYKYKIKFKIGYISGGDFDIGIGTDKVGDSCWLRTKESVCISNTGVIHMDINMDNSITIKDNDIISLEIGTEIGKKYFCGYINDKLICNLDFDINNTYIMAAIRNNNNSIEVIQYEETCI